MSSHEEVYFRDEFVAASLKPAKGKTPCIAKPQHFRDEFVAASLKRENALKYGMGAQGGFPRRIRRGLIEARSVTFVAAATCHFRDEFVAASLKRDRDVGKITGREHFRDEFVAASLKLTDSRPDQFPGSPFPRRIRRGLIEAGTALITSLSLSISATNSSRPH